MSVDTTTSLEQAVDAALGRDLTCEQIKPSCDKPATWWRIMPCCGFVQAVCGPHKNPHPASQRWHCNACGAWDVPKSGTRWEPIR